MPEMADEVARRLFEREAQAVNDYVKFALAATTASEARANLGLARRRLQDAMKMAVPAAAEESR
jgi:hypothetical protein